jgi:hypothetical protein
MPGRSREVVPFLVRVEGGTLVEGPTLVHAVLLQHSSALVVLEYRMAPLDG